MSRMEHHIGRATEVAVDATGERSKAEYIKGTVGDDLWNADEECIDYEGYVYIKDLDKLFRLDDHSEDEHGHCVLTQRHTLSGLEVYDFVLSYYNGGGGFEEVFQTAYEQMKKEE